MHFARLRAGSTVRRLVSGLPVFAATDRCVSGLDKLAIAIVLHLTSDDWLTCSLSTAIVSD